MACGEGASSTCRAVMHLAGGASADCRSCSVLYGLLSYVCTRPRPWVVATAPRPGCRQSARGVYRAADVRVKGGGRLYTAPAYSYLYMYILYGTTIRNGTCSAAGGEWPRYIVPPPWPQPRAVSYLPQQLLGYKDAPPPVWTHVTIC